MAGPMGIKIVFGGASFASNFNTPERAKSVLALLIAANVTEIDSAQMYGCEPFIGQIGAAELGFAIDSKDPQCITGVTDGKKAFHGIETTLRELKASQIDVFYFHGPDMATPLSEYLHDVDRAHKLGLFKRFGVSNYPVELLQQTYDYCKKHGLVLPTVYQGNYNAIARGQETVLFPTLQKLGIAFHAYSPLAGGFLTKSRAQLEAGAGRFSDSNVGGAMYKSMYMRDALLGCLEEWEAIAKEEGCSRAMLAYRWVCYNSPLRRESGDALIVGASSLSQLENTLKEIKAGPLSNEAVVRIDKLWDTVKDEAPYDCYTDYFLAAGLMRKV